MFFPRNGRIKTYVFPRILAYRFFSTFFASIRYICVNDCSVIFRRISKGTVIVSFLLSLHPLQKRIDLNLGRHLNTSRRSGPFQNIRTFILGLFSSFFPNFCSSPHFSSFPFAFAIKCKQFRRQPAVYARLE